MRKLKFGAAAFAGLCAFALALPASAQGDRSVMQSKDRPDTVRITVSGDMVLDYVYRSGEVTSFTEGFTAIGPLVSADSETTFEGHVAVRMNIEMSEKVSAVVEFGTKRVDGGLINEWGNATAEGIALREGHLNVSDFFTSGLSLQAGLTTWSFDMRGKGSSFAFDPRHSQSIVRGAGVGSSLTTEEVGTALGLRAGFPEEMEPVGAVLAYTSGDLTVHVVALPSVLEGGTSNADEALYAVDFFYGLDSVGKGSRIGGIFAVSSAPGKNTSVKTFGGGAVVKGLNGMDGLELYAEAYFQAGAAGQADVDGDGLVDDLDAGGTSFQIGAEYHLQSEMNFWLGVNYTMVSGDGDDAVTSTDDQVDRFLGYENVNDLMILEDMYFGFDWDSNYEAFKISGGFAMSVAGGKNNLEISAILGLVNTAEDVDFGGTVGSENRLGTEVDVKARLILGKQASIHFGLAYLMGSDILEQSMGGAANPDAEDSAMLYTFGVDAKF